MCEKDLGVSKCYIFCLYLVIPFFQLKVLLDNFEYSNVYFLIGRPIPFEYTVFGRWFSLRWITVCCLYLFHIIIIVFTESVLSVT